MSKELDRVARRGGSSPSDLQRGAAHVATRHLNRDARAPSPLGQRNRDISATARDVQNSQRPRLLLARQPSQRGPKDRGTAAEPIDPRQSAQRVSVCRRLDLRLIHQLRLTVSPRERPECGKLVCPRRHAEIVANRDGGSETAAPKNQQAHVKTREPVSMTNPIRQIFYGRNFNLPRRDVFSVIVAGMKTCP